MPACRRRARSLPRILFVALACALALMGIAAASASARPQYRGVQLHSMWGNLTDMDRELDVAQQAGANVVRVDMSWASLEQNGRGQLSQWYVDKMDHFVNGADSRGMKVLLQLQETPCWASSAPDTLRQGCAGTWWDRGVTWYPPANNADYANIVRWATAHFGDKLAAFEVWNEPNNNNTVFWNSSNKPATYAALVKAAYPAVKAGNPNLPVLAGSLADTDQAFMSALYANGIKGFYDGVAVHPYADPGWTKLARFRALQLANGDTTPLWATEFGWPTGASNSSQWHVSEADQATHIQQDFANLDTVGYVQGATLYNLRDKGTDPYNMEDNFGVIRRDYSPKPGFQALKDALTGTGTSVGTTTSGGGTTSSGGTTATSAGPTTSGGGTTSSGGTTTATSAGPTTSAPDPTTSTSGATTTGTGSGTTSTGTPSNTGGVPPKSGRRKLRPKRATRATRSKRVAKRARALARAKRR